jgi:hypothetical protein
MTHDTTPAASTPSDCTRFEEQLMALLEHDLDPGAQAWMTQHQRNCVTCDAMVQEVEMIHRKAAHAPLLSPSRDLWSGIAARIDAPVLTLPVSGVSAPPQQAQPARRTVSMRWFAVAATLLVTVTSAVTWRVARSRDAEAVRSVAVNTPRVDTVEGSMFTPAANVDEVYEQQIAALRTVVNERFAELDSTTVTELRRNLAIIDKAIADSRAALQKDPHSQMLSTSLDRALASKLALMRRVALL